MVIDFHTHTFPDAIADKSMAHLAALSGYTPYTDGRRASLLQSMRRSGVDCSVVMPVATSPKQLPTINRLSASLNGRDGIFYAGAIHPDCADVAQTLDLIRDSGLFGVKLHPDYQGADFDDPRYLAILQEAAKRGLYVVTHVGKAIGFSGPARCTPDMILRVLDRLDGALDGKLILAHLGGIEMPEQVLETLCGLPVWMDTAAVLDLYPATCTRIIKKHGADKILFATDSPWKGQKEYLELFDALDLTAEEKQMILGRNARRILGIDS